MNKSNHVLESDIEARLVQGVKRLGGRAYKWVSPGNSGVPDRIVMLPGGRVTFIELKTRTGKLSAQQKVQHKRLLDLGCAVYTLYGMEDVTTALEMWESQIRREMGLMDRVWQRLEDKRRYEK